ncbi:dna recombination rum-like protein, partial [Reticulomyxa filosa]
MDSSDSIGKHDKICSITMGVNRLLTLLFLFFKFKKKKKKKKKKEMNTRWKTEDELEELKTSQLEANMDQLPLANKWTELEQQIQQGQEINTTASAQTKEKSGIENSLAPSVQSSSEQDISNGSLENALEVDDVTTLGGDVLGGHFRQINGLLKMQQKEIYTQLDYSNTGIADILRDIKKNAQDQQDLM